MTTMSIDEFVAALRDWAGQRNAQFRFYWPVKGGWEGWAQVDLTAFIISRLPTLEILREQPIFTDNRQKVDLLINGDQDPAAQIAVELKVQSFENRTRFVAGVAADLDKFADVDDAYSETSCIMVAAPFNQATLDEVKGLEMDGHPVFLEIFKGEVAIAVAVWTEARGWINPYGAGAATSRKRSRAAQPGAATTGFGTPSDFGTAAMFTPPVTFASPWSPQPVGR